jgi:mono/diheme cytochrome c family protein
MRTSFNGTDRRILQQRLDSATGTATPVCKKRSSGGNWVPQVQAIQAAFAQSETKKIVGRSAIRYPAIEKAPPVRKIQILRWVPPLLFAFVGATYSAHAEQRGNAEAGRALVTRSCTTCHGAAGAQTVSDAAPPLSFLARDTKERSAFVRGWLMNPHPPMPGIMLSRQQISDIVAYLETLPDERGNVEKGQRIATQVCAQCHAVQPGKLQSPNRAAPSFADIVASPGLTATAIRVWLQTPHPTMPNIKLDAQDKDSIVAYLLSLKAV